MQAALDAEDIASMRKVVEEAVASGAVGFSSSRVSIHRDGSGVLLPGKNDARLVSVCAAVRSTGPLRH